MEREFITIETPVDKKKVELKAWITGEEKRKLRNVYLSNIKVDFVGDSTQIKDFKVSEVIEKVEDEAITIVVVSVDGKLENVLSNVLNLKEKDYDFVVKEINKITRDVNFQMPGQKQSVGTDSEG